MKGVNQGVLSKHQENHLFLERNKESESSKSAGDLDEDARLEQNEPDRVQARSKRDQWSKKWISLLHASVVVWDLVISGDFHTCATKMEEVIYFASIMKQS